MVRGGLSHAAIRLCPSTTHVACAVCQRAVSLTRRFTAPIHVTRVTEQALRTDTWRSSRSGPSPPFSERLCGPATSSWTECTMLPSSGQRTTSVVKWPNRCGTADWPGLHVTTLTCCLYRYHTAWRCMPRYNTEPRRAAVAWLHDECRGHPHPYSAYRLSRAQALRAKRVQLVRRAAGAPASLRLLTIARR